MIKLRNVKYDKKSGIITAIARYEDEADYDVVVDTNDWSINSSNPDIPDIVVGKVRDKFMEFISLKRKITSEILIMWY